MSARRIGAGLIASATIAVTAEIVVRIHRDTHCLDVTSAGCQRWAYAGTPSWAVAAAVLVGLAGGLTAVLLVSQPR
jgi:hypothetical protein